MKGINISGNNKTRKTDILTNLQNDNDFYYLLGLLATDGSVADDSSVIRIGLSPCDIDCLKTLYQKFGGNIIHYRKEENEITKNPEYVTWSIIDYNFRIFLETIGITPRKSLTLDINKYFESLTHVQQGFFMRGVIDGDGSVIISPNAKHTAVRGKISIGTGSLKFAMLIKKFSPETILVKSKTQITKNDFWLLTASDANFTKLYNRCYYHIPSMCKLSRKYNLINKLAELQDIKNKYSHQRYYELTNGANLYKFKSISELVAFLKPHGITKWHVTNKNFGKYTLVRSVPTCQILTAEFFKKYPEIINPLNQNSSVEPL